MTDLGQFFNSIPRFTRYWFTTTFTMSVLSRFGLIPLEYTNLNRDLVLGRFELWRCFTSLFVYPLYPSAAGFHFMINCFFILQYSGRLEKYQFHRAPADYLYQLLFSALMCILCGLFFDLPFLMDPLVVSATYIWCHLNQDVIVTFWFGTRFKAVYLPWVLAGINLIFNGSIDSLIGIFVGHLYYFLKFQYPQELGGAEFLSTPRILKQYVPDVSGGMGGFGMPAESANPQPPPAAGNRIFGNAWGRGNTLGRD